MNRLVKIKYLKTGKIYIVACYLPDDYKNLLNKKRFEILEQRDFTTFQNLITWCNNHNILPY